VTPRFENSIGPYGTNQIRSSRRSKSKHMPSYYSEVLAIREGNFIQLLIRMTLKNLTPSCVFYGDLFPNKEHYTESVARDITLLIEARQKFAYGALKEYLFDKNCIGFVRKGDTKHPGCVVILSNREEG